METRKITIGFSRSTKFFPIFSWGVMFWESLYHSIKEKRIILVKHSHCYLKFDTRKIFDVDTVYHAAINMIHYIPYPKFIEKNKIVKEIEIEIPYNIYEDIRKKLHNNLSVDYGNLQNLGIFLVDSVELILGKDINNPFKKGYNCAEAALECMIALEPEISNIANSNKIKTYETRMLAEKFFEGQDGKDR